MIDTHAERFMQALQQMEKTRELEPLLAFFTDDSELSNLASAEPLQGHAGARQFWERYLANFKQINSQFTHQIESDSEAVLEWVANAELATGRSITYRGVTLLTFEGDHVRRFRTYYDSAAFVQLEGKADPAG